MDSIAHSSFQIFADIFFLLQRNDIPTGLVMLFMWQAYRFGKNAGRSIKLKENNDITAFGPNRAEQLGKSVRKWWSWPRKSAFSSTTNGTYLEK